MTQPEAQAAGTDTQHVGNRVRQLRQAKGISGRELATRAGIDPSYISRIENAKVSPTVATLGRVVQAMGETVASLFSDTQDEGPVVRADERRRLRSRGVDDYRVTPAWSSRLEVLESIIQPNQGSGSGPHTHPGDEECVLVMEGQLTVWLDGCEHLLGPGDSATFLCNLPHQWRNASRQPSRVLWIITPAIY